jgi:hypothetical protein
MSMPLDNVTKIFDPALQKTGSGCLMLHYSTSLDVELEANLV